MTSARSLPNGIALVTRPERVEAALWRRLRNEGTVECRERLFVQYQGFARSIARRYARTGGYDAPTQFDLEQAAYHGLLQAIDRFDPARNIPFAGYARQRIIGGIKDTAAQLSENGARADFLRRRDRERLRSIKGTEGEESKSLHSALNQLSDIATQLALALMLDRQEHDELSEARNNAFDSLAWRQMADKLTEHVAQLPKAEQLVIKQHYENEVLFTQIAAMMGISKGRVSQLHKSALQRLAGKMRVI